MTDRQRKLLASYYAPKVEEDLVESKAAETEEVPEEITETKAVEKPKRRRAKRTPSKTSKKK